MSIATPIIEMHYLPCIAYIKEISKYCAVTIEAYEHFIKQTYRNRCSIYGANGKQDLIIPLVKKSAKIPVKDLQISYDMKWQHTHFMSIHSAYKSSPYYDFYEEEVRALFSLKEKYLLDFNIKCLEWVLNVLKLPTTINLTEQYVVSDEVEHDLDLRNQIHPKKEIVVEHPKYLQVFEERHGFIENLSIIDWIFNDLQGARSYFS